MLALIFHKEIATDDHRLGLRVIDVRRDNRAAASDFVAHEFRCYFAWDACSEWFAGMLLTKIVSIVAAAAGCGTAVSGARRTAISWLQKTNSRGQDFHGSR